MMWFLKEEEVGGSGLDEPLSFKSGGCELSGGGGKGEEVERTRKVI